MRRWGPLGALAAAGFAASLMAGAPALCAADPDFPGIPTQSSSDGPDPGGEAGAGTTAESTDSPPEDQGEESGGLASAQDCAVIKSFVSHLDVVLSRQVPVTGAFPTKEAGEQAVNQDLDVLNNALPFIVYAETGLQDLQQRAKVTAYKGDLGQLSPILAERLKQDLTIAAPYGWAEKLSQANNRAGADYLKIGNSCLM